MTGEDSNSKGIQEALECSSFLRKWENVPSSQTMLSCGGRSLNFE